MEQLQDIANRVEASVEDILTFLDSPTGRKLRRTVAAGLIVSAPLVSRIPGLRSTPAGRLLQFTGGTAFLVKLAEAIRDWERSQPGHEVIDVPRVS
ncbi:MAG: hypothetical protein ABJC60_10090 [Actinomycetota bacterium]